MFFTQEDYRKIEKWLLANSRKDTDFVGAVTPLKGNETVVLVQNGKNVKTSVKDVVEQLFLLGVSDFVNITDKYGESYISLSQAIELIPYRSRKIGQVVTFLDDTGKWAMFQFQGTRKNQWGTLSLWVDLIDLMTGLTITDSEDIVTETNSANQVALKFADKTYNEADYSGLGRVYLRKNIVNIEDPVTGNVVKMNYLTQSMISKENTIYIIQYDYSLNGQTIIIPDNCVLKFEGGQLKNGTINFNNCNIDNIGNSIILNNCTLKGSLNKQVIYSDWFYFNSDDCTDTLNDVFKISEGCRFIISEGVYKISVKNLVGTDYADPINTSILQPQSNSHITINGTIQLIPNDRTHYNIIGIVDKDNILLDGTGEIIGDVETHTGTTGEWGHGVLISGSRNINVKDLRISYCWGDGLSVSYAEKILTDKGLVNSPYSPPEIINITNIKSSYNRRLGISIINGDGIILENSITEGNGTINGTSPKAGLDIEPNPNQSVNNVIVNGCLFYDNVVTYFPSDGLIKDEAISCIIQNSICKKQVTIGNVGKVIGCEIKYLLINGSRFVNIQNNVITEALVLSGTTITGLNVIDNTFLGLTTDGYDSCIRVSCDSFSKVNIASNNFSLCTNSNMRKLVTYTKKQTNAIDIVDSVITYDKTLTLLFYPYANFYNCEFIFSGFNIYNITSELDKYPDSCSFIGCKFAANNSSFYIRDNITDNYKITIENCEYYTKQDNPTDFINYIGHTIALDLVVLNNKGKSVFLKNDIDEAHKRPIINNNYNGHRFYNLTNKRPEYYYNNNWWDSCGYNVNENRNSDGTLIEKVRIVSDSSKIVNSNIRYVIVSDIDLQGETLTIPAGCTLDFQGGSISNGIITGTSIGNTYLRPEWFGAKGDNSANDSAAFQMAINLCNSSNCKVLKLKEATYLIDDITIPSNISIIGADKYKSILKSYANPLNTPILKSDDAQGNNIVLRNLTIESAGERTEYTVKILNKVGVIIDNCYFVRHVVGSTPNDFHGIFIGRKEGTETTYVTKFTNNRVNQCCVTIEGTDGYIDHNEIWGIGCKSALHLIKSGNHMISNNQIVGGSVYGAIYCTDWATALKIFGNYFDGSSTIVANVPYALNIDCNFTYSLVSNNNFWHIYGTAIRVKVSIGSIFNGNVFENNDTADTGVSDIVLESTQSGGISNNSFVRAAVTRTNKAPVLDITGYDSTSYEPIVISGNIMRGYLNYAAASYNPLSSVIKSVNNGHQYFEYIKNNSPYRIFTSDGEVNYVSSADISSDPLASRVYTYLEGGGKPRLDNLTYVNAGNMPTSSKFDFSATYNKDFKLYIGSIDQVLNAPTWLTGGMWLENYYTADNYCIQKIISSSTTYTRTCNNGTWSSWYKIEGTILT